MTFPLHCTPLGFETLTVSTSAVGLTSTVFENVGDVKANARFALVTVAAQPVRWRVDGTAPTATVGHLFAAGTSFYIWGKAALKKFRAIRDTAAASDSVLSVSYFA